MGLLSYYFVAPSVADAAATIDRSGGPANADVTPTRKRFGLFASREAPAAEAFAYPTVFGGGNEPVVQMGTLEAVLTGRDYDDIANEAADDLIVAVRGQGERLVVKLSDGLTSALASADPARLDDVAVPWSRTDEFWGQGDPAVLAPFLKELAALATSGAELGQGMYCWVAV